MFVPGAITTTDQGSNATGAQAVGVPSTTSPRRCFAQSKRSLAHWILATFLLCLSCSSHRIARELGVHVRTSYRWCWRLRNTAVSYEIDRQLEGTVEADDLYHTAGSCTSSLRLSLPPVNRVKSPHFSTCMRGFYHDTRSLFLSVGAGRPGVVVRHT